MRGVAAVLGRSRRADRETVARMLAASPHRGDRQAVASAGACVVGVSERGGSNEATLASDDELVVGFAGALDNHAELATRFGLETGQAAQPADVVLAAFRAVGTETPPLLRGTYACVVSDGARIWAFRDHIGLETLFHRDEADAVYVASEAKQVLGGAEMSPEPDVDVVDALFYGDLEDPTVCALRGVRRLVAASLLTADADGLRVSPYWDPEALLETARLSPEEAMERFRELFHQAVGRTLTGRDAVSLSGGVDSPPVAVYGNREYVRRFGRPIPALSAVYPTFPESDETDYIQLVAERLGLPLHTYEPGSQRLDRLQFWLKLFDGPWSTWSPEGTAERCTQAQAHGFTTIVSGEFAEQVSAVRAYLVPHLLWRGRFRQAAAQLRSQRGVGISRRTLVSELAEAVTPRVLQARRFRRNPPGFLPPWIDLARIGARDAGHALPARRRWISAQLPFFGADPIGEADVYSHALYGIRARRPWADVDVWEFFLGLPAEHKFPDYRIKGFVRNAFRGVVPDEILDRRDKTYIDRWFQEMAFDYPAVRHWVSRDGFRIRGVDYERLRAELEREEMPLPHYLWARDLACVHAFIDLWS
ncbi:MAG TPA: asparagine synthase-related protein [Gaiellaceae bacterium]|nr:asparagine synthase-related protein [Gaiellaceae bacterium]